MPECAGKPRDESCNRNTDIKRETVGKEREREGGEREGEKKDKRVKAAETTDIYFSRGKERKKTKKQKTIYRATQECATE